MSWEDEETCYSDDGDDYCPDVESPGPSNDDWYEDNEDLEGEDWDD